MSLFAFWHAKQFNPRNPRSVFLNDLVGPVRFEPSLTITHFSGVIVCEATDWIVNSIDRSSFRAGVTITYDGSFSTMTTHLMSDVAASRTLELIRPEASKERETSTLASTSYTRF